MTMLRLPPRCSGEFKINKINYTDLYITQQETFDSKRAMKFLRSSLSLYSFLSNLGPRYVVLFLSRIDTLYWQYVLGSFIQYVMLTPSILFYFYFVF
jgi:hypothetical protein